MTSMAALDAVMRRCTAWYRVGVSGSPRNKPDRPSDTPFAFTSSFDSKTKSHRHSLRPHDIREALFVKRGRETSNVLP